MGRTMKAITHAEREFCKALLRGMGKRQAAIAAGYAESAAHVMASNLLQRPQVKAYLESHYKRGEDELAIDRERVRAKLLNMATAEASQVFADDWSLLPKSEIPAEVQSLVINARTWDTPEQGKGSSVKLINQLDAAAKFLKLFPPAPTQAETLEGAAEEVDGELADLMCRLEPPDDGTG